MSGDHQDRDGIPLPTGPLEEAAGGEVVDLRPAAGRARRPALPAAELAVSSYGEVAARVAAAGEPRWLIQGLWPADAYGVLAAQEKAGKTWAALDLAVSRRHRAALARPLRLPHPRPGPGLPGRRRGAGHGPPDRGHRHQQRRRPRPAGRPAPAVLPRAPAGRPRRRRRAGRHPGRTRSAPGRPGRPGPAVSGRGRGQRLEPVRHGRRPPGHPRRLPARRVRLAGGDPLEQDRRRPRRRPHQRGRPGRLGPGHLLGLDPAPGQRRRRGQHASCSGSR